MSHFSVSNKPTEHQEAPLWTWCQIVSHKWEDISPPPQGNCYGSGPGHHSSCLGVWCSNSQCGDNRRQDKSTSCCHTAIKMQPTPSWKAWHGRHGKSTMYGIKGGKWPFVPTWEAPRKAILVGCSCHKVGGLNVTILLTILEIGSPRSR